MFRHELSSVVLTKLVSCVLCPQSVWSPNSPGSTWPTLCGSRSRICSTGSTGRRWASSTRCKCLTRGSRTTQTQSSSRVCRLGFLSGSPAPSAPRTWRGSWPWPTKSASPSLGRENTVPLVLHLEFLVCF